MSKYFVFCKIDAEKGKGPALAREYGVSGYPALRFLKPAWSTVHQFDGYMPADPFIKEMEKAAQMGGMK